MERYTRPGCSEAGTLPPLPLQSDVQQAFQAREHGDSVYRLNSRRNFFNESPRGCVELGNTTHSVDGFGDTVRFSKTFVRNLFFGETPAPFAMVPSPDEKITGVGVFLGFR